jgi:hypothetical protein
MESYNDYIKKYGSFTHILTIFLNNKLSETEKSTVISSIYSMLNRKPIQKNILGSDFRLTWSVANENNLLHYYSNGYLSDFAIKIHTELVLNDIEEKIGSNKFSYLITKLLTTPISVL